MTCFRFFTVMLLSFVMIIPNNIEAAEMKPKEAADQNTVTWLWHTEQILQETEEIITFLSNNKVKHLYLQVDYALAFEDYKRFIEKAAVSGISVHALEGSAEWVSENGINSSQKFFDWLRRYNHEADVMQRFKGVHLDIEPYLNPQYIISKNKLLENYQKVLLDAQAKSKELGLPLSADMPFWFDEVKYSTKYGKGLLAEWVIKNIKSVVVMAYRDKAEGKNGIIRLIANEMKWGRQYGCIVIVGAETQQITDEKNISFYEKGNQYMHTELNKVYQDYKKNSSFGGFGIHHMTSWRDLSN